MVTKPPTDSETSGITVSLDRIRKKLLDLSRRNRLLNYRAGSRSLPIVDELPDEVFRMLVTGEKTMYFAPLPEPDEDEETDNSPDLFNPSSDGPASTGRTRSRMQNGVRVENELPNLHDSIDPEAKHEDEFLQTQLYARDLERRLKKISGDAQSAIEESGTNILYLALGFLEWYEDDNSNEKNRAPLILIPVTLERGKFDARAFRYRYSLSYSGEDIVPNLSLTEKLKQDFGIAFPEIDEDLHPERYFERVKDAVAEKRRWHIAREMTLGMFSFGKLLMYLDLDPDKWPATNPLIKHPIITTLLEGNREADGNPYGEVYNIDADPQAAAIPLVVDADSSQHSAIIDAVSGRNLVIEGPPGTGKSQTITNLIALGLAQGKNVLFVSEKLAALEVVRRNLDKAGLGDFCLELHSHKTQKQKLLKDIEARLNKKYNKVERHAETLAELTNLKKSLQSYVDVINEKYGKSDLTVYEILWRAERARSAFSTPPRVQITNPTNTTASDIKLRLEALIEVKEHWAGLEPDTISAWRGFSLHTYYQPDASDLEEILKRVLGCCAKIVEACNDLPSATAGAGVLTSDGANKLVSSHDTLRKVPNDLDQSLVTVLALPRTAPLIKIIESASTAISPATDVRAPQTSEAEGDLRSLYQAIEALAQLVSSAASTSATVHRVSAWCTGIARGLTTLEQRCKDFADVAKISHPASLREIREICDAARLASKAPGDLVIHVRPSMLSQDTTEILGKAEHQASKLSIKAIELQEKFNLASLPDRESLNSILHALQTHERSLLRFLSSDFRQAKAKFLGFVRDARAHARGTWAQNVSELVRYIDAKNTYARNQEYRDRFGVLFSGTDTDWTRLRRLLSWTGEVGQAVSNRALLNILLSRDERVIFTLGSEYQRLVAAAGGFASSADDALRQIRQTSDWIASLQACGLPVAFEQWLLDADALGHAKILSKIADAIRPHVASVNEDLKQLRRFGEYDELSIFNAGVFDSPLQKIVERLSAWLTNLPSAGKWAEYCRAVQYARNIGLQPILERFEAGEFAADQMPRAFEFALYNSLARTIIREHPLLRDFTRIGHERIRARFAEIDRQILRLNRELIAHQASTRKPPAGISTGPVKRHTEMGLLHHETNKKKRHVPIRQLMTRAGKALQAIKPCFMMGPLSVAQYVPPGLLEFDLIIMDEASQVKPEEALGAIARGKQIIIVGDPKQLPPTSFFDRFGEAEIDEEEELALDDSESILDICMQVYRPARRLCWHYRSEHESLINFSNHEFYDKDLILFPSPVGLGHGLGVRFHHIKGAVYDSRRNKAEAETVARAVMAHAQHHKELSLGVGTFNIQQKELIEDYIERFRTTNPVLDEFLQKHNANSSPFFVKNLENIQGDERDVIFISTTYGPDSASGKVMQRFGPINTQGGWRRLNVIVTRAKKRTEVFSSMTSSDVLVTSSSSPGVRALRSYLEYVEKGGVITTKAVSTGRDPDTPFEESVAHVLQQAGYAAVPQIGVAGYFIDIGVAHPTRPGEYILGVECDGATYHSAKSARDRDRLRQDVLESRGWKIHRIWSTDWFNNREAEIKRVLQKVEQCVRESGGAIQSLWPTPEETAIGRTVSAVADLGRQPAPLISAPATIQQKKLALSGIEARQKLLELYKNKILPKFPNHERAILRKEMLEAFLRNRPTTTEEFREFIPLRFREATDPKQMEFLPEILEILKEVSD
jgi:very-short-patch-repair endonuclease